MTTGHRNPIAPPRRRSSKLARPIGGFVLLLVLVALPSLASEPGATASEPTHEPRPPELLRLVEVPGAEADDVMLIEAVLSAELDAEVELEVLEPGDVQFEGHGRRIAHSMRRGDPLRRERLRVKNVSRRSGKLRVRLSLLEANGQPWLVTIHELAIGKSAHAAKPSAKPRVPVVRVLPDGTRIVEYMGAAQATRAGPPLVGNESLSRPRAKPSTAAGPESGGPPRGPLESD
jgi:hypothetical protein